MREHQRLNKKQKNVNKSDISSGVAEYSARKIILRPIDKY